MTDPKPRPHAKLAATGDGPSPPRVPMPDKEPPPRHGEHRELHPGTDQIFILGAYKDGLQQGSWKKYDKAGQLQEDYTWERGAKDGPELDWHPSGAKNCVGQNRRGQRVGKWTWWYPDGAFLQTYTYDEQGRRQGAYLWDHADGTPRAKGQWLDDQFHGQWSWWKEPQWEKIERGYYQGAQHGREIAWHPGGVVAFKRGYHRGQKHGEERVFDAAGNPLYRGDWHYGHPTGEHISWDGAQKETRTKYLGGLPETLITDDKLRDRMVKKLKKAKDPFAKADALGDGVDYAYRAAYLIYLWRSGLLDVAADKDLWKLLGEASGLLSGQDVIALLHKVKTASAHANVLPYWPADLDRLVMEVYQRDPGPIDAAWQSLPAPMNNAVSFVRARFGHDIGKILHKELPAIVKKHVEQYGLDEVLWPDESGVVTLQKIFCDFYGTKTPLFDKLIALFGSMDDWVAELRQLAFLKADETSASVSFRIFRDVIERATPAEVARLIDGITLDSDTQEMIHLALTRWRSDDAATLCQIALAVKHSGLSKWPTVATAINKYHAEGSVPPQALVDAIELADESPTYTSSWYTEPLRHLGDQQKVHPVYRVAYVDSSIGAASPRTKLIQEAMRSLTPASARSVIDRALLQQYGKTVAAQYLHLVDDPALWERFLDIAEADPYGSASKVVYGLGELGLRAIPLLTARLLRTKKKEWSEGYSSAILIALARGIVDSGPFSPELDRFVRFDVTKDDAEFRAYAPFVERILCKLPAARAEAVLINGLSASSAACFARAFAVIACCPTKAVLAAAFGQLLRRENMLKHEQQRDIGAGVASLSDATAWVRWIRQSGGGGGLGDTLKKAIGWKVYEELEEELAADGAGYSVALRH